MSIPQSTAPAVRQWLYDQCTAGLAPDPVNTRASLLVVFDAPGPNEPDDIVAIGRVRRQLQAGAMVGGGGPGFLDEHYTVEIVVDVFRGSDSGQVAYTRAMDLANSVIAIVRTDLTLGGNVIKSQPKGDDAEVEWDSEHGGKRACVTVEIECVTRI
ncbi:hypothetical protein AB0958_21815 [Streptomyces sp. NPDC006655]|uniref:hypothetical protein n=1 Tax=Streptomyces sp. NPDC006655 TaxID=3156898 RepID=UPI0034523BE2